MDTIKRIFPLSFQANDLSSFIKTILLYLVLDVICAIVIGILRIFPLIGGCFAFIGSLLGVYFTIGLVLATLVFVGIIKN